jgi:hypothetical protein
MSDKPIIFSAPMVQALLAGRKTQTRRILQYPPIEGLIWSPRTGIPYRIDDFGVIKYAPFPYQVGDRLWVRENCRASECLGSEDMVVYPATQTAIAIQNNRDAADRWLALYSYGQKATRGHVVPSIHMPRWASRMTLVVTGVKIERLRDISEEDSRAEGVIEDDGDMPGIWYVPGARLPRHGSTAYEAFMMLWQSINGREPANPWVVAVSFDVVKANIDAIGAQP